ncbi:NAD(P)H-binding protein [Fictibacillus sp. b24]|uniref:NAD(P)H-binding protein n=1 Tax=unclassified Fictibacillus TaxID=2644029 RepID=UPI0025A04387|nr:NAD(P)H-binding protein [Fictibacillus sp. b24]MDM5316331.1 NAD(P)H-binding protein [Fictibacillus sp. b24]
MNSETVIIAGSSGLVGQEVVKQLLNDPMCQEIIMLVRKATDIKHEKIKEIIFDFSAPEYRLENIKADAMFICIGTTMKKAKSKSAFEEVDLHIPVKLGRLAQKLNIKHLSVISALGANAKSTFFYNRVKGKMESQLISMNLPHLTIVRPSLLIGVRDEFRLGERFAEKLYKALPSVYPKKYEPIEASSVANTLIKESFKPHYQKVNILENKKIHEISRNS